MSGVMTELADDVQRDRLVRRFGAKARSWLAGLPALVDELAGEWKLSIIGRAPHGQTSVVLFARRVDGSAAVLKMSPDPALLATEACTLGLWRETGRVPAVWEVDEQRGGLLLEAVEPGEHVADMTTWPPLEEIARLIRDLHTARVPEDKVSRLRPLQSRVNFVYHLWEQRRVQGRAADLVPPVLLHHGHARARALTANQDNVVALHGDLHPHNVLNGGPRRGLVAIDPRACVGDAAVDAMNWALWGVASREEVDRRISVLAPAIGSSQERLLGWCRAIAPILAISRANRGEAHLPEFEVLMSLSAC
ncbi:aminoglycoside phosphotransferase family protein [Marinactinospora rubrisoli]|uniref:Aminoglycoside phosphotransferase family protein n=1 Tax=Marinactinospora rubrisoli TaxID=2715399 RepID=A0ABW2KES1_9ACTN